MKGVGSGERRVKGEGWKVEIVVVLTNTFKKALYASILIIILQLVKIPGGKRHKVIIINSE